MNTFVPFRLLDICNQQLVSGAKPVPDSAFSASSSYHKGSNTKDYTVARARINTTETKDSKGVLHLGAWSAQTLNVDQWIQVRPFGVPTPKTFFGYQNEQFYQVNFFTILSWETNVIFYIYIYMIDISNFSSNYSK